jgi:DNA ligase (NAD+)
MATPQVKKRIEKLRELINYYREQYHVYDTSIIPDSALDSLKKELSDLETANPELITPDSPSQRVAGRPLDKFEKAEHTNPVLSLQDIFSFEEFLEYKKRIAKLLPKTAKLDYFTELKLDGLTMVLTYEDGIFVRGATRGNGRVGENVTNNLKTVEAIPLKLKMKKGMPRVIEVRGEIVMGKKEFDRINKIQEKKGGVLYANPRNTAAGSIRQLDPAITASRKLDFFAFDMITDLGQTTHKEVHDILKQLGFKVNPHNEYCKDDAAVKKYLAKWETKRKKLDYGTDGVVIVVNKVEYEKELGSVGKTERWMIAYKFPAEQVTTQVLNIIPQVGRTGVVTPVAVMKPVKVAGSTVSRATLHNEDIMQKLDIRIGDTVILQKAGDVIPEIVKVLPELRTGREKKFVFPKHCPVCGSQVTRIKGEAAYRCTNRTSCAAQEVEQLIHFVSKAGFDMEGFGPAIIEQLIDAGLVTQPADFFQLQAGDISPLERLGEKSEKNLIDSVNSRRKVTLAKFIYALGIPLVGEQTSADIASFIEHEDIFKSKKPLETALKKLSETPQEELAHIEGIGEKVAQTIHEYFKNPQMKKRLEHLLRQDVVLERPARVHEKKGVTGKSFIFTGSISMPRSLAKEKVKRLGGKVVSSVSKATDFVVAGDDPGSKFTKAQDLGIKIIDEDAFKKMIGE